MNYVAIGILGFLVGYLSDWAALKGIRGAKPVLTVTSYTLIVYSLVMLCLASDRISLPLWLTFLGVVTLGLSCFLLVYALFINLPFRRTYITDGGRLSLVRTGMYALVRHPGVLWWGLLLISLILVSRSKLLLFTAPLWMALDVLWVVIQEKFLFNQMFDGYEGYRRETPMLIPNGKSIRVFISGLKQMRKGEANARGA